MADQLREGFANGRVEISGDVRDGFHAASIAARRKNVKTGGQCANKNLRQDATDDFAVNVGEAAVETVVVWLTSSNAPRRTSSAISQTFGRSLAYFSVPRQLAQGSHGGVPSDDSWRTERSSPALDRSPESDCQRRELRCGELL